jgi:hypothetical protein
MKLWRGEPEHDHWRVLITRRDRAITSFALGLAAIGYAAFKLFEPTASCGDSHRLLCSLAHATAGVLGISLFAAEAALWGGLGLASIALAAAYWRAG